MLMVQPTEEKPAFFMPEVIDSLLIDFFKKSVYETRVGMVGI
jgi:hypothetical protein